MINGDMVCPHTFYMARQIHKQLENKISEFLQTEDTILYSSALMQIQAYLKQFCPLRMLSSVMN